MNARISLNITSVVIAFGFIAPASADPFNARTGANMTAVEIIQANLHTDLEVPVLPNMSPRISTPEFVLDNGPDPAPLIQVAGRCGSSNYYCNESGFTYCCGNSSDGFYCAADVNGCTK
ncbi:hypothetical protein LP7551_04665 [Roseibium album]|nr:hypothetical protein LP7551_04665 [Roseibium album]